MISKFTFPAIYDGKNAFSGDFPYYVSIESRGYICGGAIIAKYWIVTTAHDTLHEYPDSLQVRAGTVFRESNGSLHQVDTIYRHENFDDKSRMYPNDIALMHVSEPFAFDATRQPIALPDPEESLVPGEMAKVCGLGVTRGGFLPEYLQYVEVPVVDDELCDLAYHGDVPEGKFCAAYLGSGGRNVVYGDEGGPLTVDDRLAGIVSWIYVMDDPDYPPVYTDVSFYRDWIDRHVRYA